MKGGVGLPVGEWLTRYGWNFEKVDDQLWMTGWQGDTKSFPLTVRINSTWVHFEVPHLVDFEVDFNIWPELSKKILELNNEVQMLKLSLDEEAKISLSGQIYCKNLDFHMFSETLGVIGYYADELFSMLIDEANHIGVFNSQYENYATPN